MSLLGDFLGGTAEALAENIDKTSENKRVLAEQMRREAVQRSESDRLRRLDREDEDRKLGREVKEQYPDLATKQMVTIFKDGSEERRPLRANELKAMEREDADFDRRGRFMEAQIGAMGRPNVASTKPVTVGNDSLLASMGFESKDELYDSGDTKAIEVYEAMLGTKLAPEELTDFRARLQTIARDRRQAGTVLDAEQAASAAGLPVPLYFDTGSANQVRASEVARQAQLRKQQEMRKRLER